MINGQPTQGTKAKRQWQRKLTAALMAGVLVLLPASPAVAAVVNSVVATGTANGQPVSASTSTSVDVQDAAPAMTIDKIGTLNDGGDGSADVNDTISYTFTIRNTGNVTLQNITLSDTGATLVGAPLASLAPSFSNIGNFSAVHTLTALDITSGLYSNTVNASAHSANAPVLAGQNVTATDTEATPLNILSAMKLEKTGVLNLGTNGRADAGDTITYSFKVTNTGPTQLHDINVSDPLVNLANLPGQERMIALLDAQDQPSDPLNTATILGETTTSANEHFAAADQFAAFYQTPHSIPPIASNISVVRRLVRMTGSEGDLVEGDKIGFVYALTNTGEGPLTDINVIQPKAEAYGDKLSLLAPNESDSANIIFTHVLTDEEAALGEVESPATVTANSRGRVLTSALNETMPLAGIPTFDNFASATISPTTVATLNAGQFTTFTATYILKQIDLDRGYIDNTATATAKNTADQTLNSVSSFHQILVPVPAIAVIKTGQLDLGADNVASIGDIVTYHFAITNTGNVTLDPVTLTDPKAVVVGTPIANLLPGLTYTNSTAYTATHALDQDDLDAGLVSNQAIVRGTSPTGIVLNRLSDDDSLTQTDPTLVGLGPDPKIGLLKTVFTVTDVNNNGRTDANDTITYHFAVTNTGNQTLTDILVTDPKPVRVDDSFGLGHQPALPLDTLKPGQTNTNYFFSIYTITQADVDLGHVDNTAHVVGTAPGGIEVDDDSDPGVLTQDGPTIATITPAPAISLIKTSTITDTNFNNINDANDVIHYVFKVENQGNVTLHAISITDPLPNIIGPVATLAQLDPLTYDDTTFTATYIITPADVAAGRVTNRAQVKASSPTGVEVKDFSDNASPNADNPTVTALKPLPEISVIKTITAILDSNSSNVTDVGDTITYAFKVKNTGNLLLNNVYVTDPIVAVAGLHLTTLPAGNEDTTTFTASYVIQPADISAGFVSNQATGQGTPTSLPTVKDLSDDNSYAENESTVAYLANAAGIAVIKQVDFVQDVNFSGTADELDIIHYKFSVTNTGNITLNSITLADTNATLVCGPLALVCVPLATLAPSVVDQTTFTATHEITHADFLAGFVDNEAIITGYYPSATARSLSGQASVSDTSDAISFTADGPTRTPLSSVPKIALVKTVKNIDDKNRNGFTDVGDVIVYAFAVTNTGNTNLTAVTLTDGTATVAPALTPLASLPIGTSNTAYFTAEHKITLADALAGFVSNTADVSATTPTSTVVTDTSDNASISGNAPTVTPVTLPTPVLTKTADKNEVKRGETVTYTITASNLAGASYAITDIMPPEFGFVAGSATLNGVAATPILNGRNIDFASTAPVAGKITIKLKLLASTTLAGGKFVNNATLTDSLTGLVVGKAQATVTIAIEAVFDCSDIIGHVFDDQNGNGYMDDGEPGLPGVRVVSLNGVLITTDAEGRYHVPCAAVPDAKIGSNYLLKLDTRTLPEGYALTTENPRDVRVTKGKVVKLNFGASNGKAVAPRTVKLDLSGKAFDAGSADLTTKWATSLDKLIDVLAKKPANLRIVYHAKGESAELAKARLNAVEETITFAWNSVKPPYALSITSTLEAGK